MIFTLTDERGTDHQVAAVVNADGTRSVAHDGDAYTPDEARRLAHALLDSAAVIDAASAR